MKSSVRGWISKRALFENYSKSIDLFLNQISASPPLIEEKGVPSGEGEPRDSSAIPLDPLV